MGTLTGMPYIYCGTLAWIRVGYSMLTCGPHHADMCGPHHADMRGLLHADVRILRACSMQVSYQRIRYPNRMGKRD